jgi:TonB family protein
MSSGIASPPPQGAVAKRRVPRYKLAVPLDLTVLRSGIPGTVPARSVEIGEGGMGVLSATQLVVGESVRVEFLIPHTSTPVRATAVVRYQRGGSFGLEFLRLPDDQRSIIRYWTRREGELLLATQSGRASAEKPSDAARAAVVDEAEETKRRFVPGSWAGSIVAFLLITAGLGWWQWEQGWAEIEANLPEKAAPASTQPAMKVDAAAMERLVVHRIMPEYPDGARRAGVQGSVLLGAVVSDTGTVTQLKVLSGPEILGQAAMDAVRWWRYEPYRSNGRAVPVETTVAVNFRLAN